MANSNVLGKVTSLIVTKGKDNRGSNSVINRMTLIYYCKRATSRW